MILRCPDIAADLDFCDFDPSNFRNIWIEFIPLRLAGLAATVSINEILFADAVAVVDTLLVQLFRGQRLPIDSCDVILGHSRMRNALPVCIIEVVIVPALADRELRAVLSIPIRPSVVAVSLPVVHLRN